MKSLYRMKVLSTLALLSVALMPSISSAQTYSYSRITQRSSDGTLSGFGAYSLNAQGRISGSASTTSAPLRQVAAIGDGADVFGLPTPTKFQYSLADSTINSGLTAGQAGDANGSHAVMWDKYGSFTDISESIPGAQASTGLNIMGSIIGTVSGRPGIQGFCFQCSRALLPFLPKGINKTGVVVGLDTSKQHAMLMDANGVITDLTPLTGSVFADAIDINDAGTIALTAVFKVNGVTRTRGFALFANGQLVPLPVTDPNSDVRLIDMNNYNDIIGETIKTVGDEEITEQFVWNRGSGLRYLKDAVPSLDMSLNHIVEARSINSDRSILVIVDEYLSGYHPFILSLIK